MTEDITPASDQDQMTSPFSEGDGMLGVLVSTMSRSDGSLGVTLCAGGAVITGELVGVNRWWRELDEAHGGQLKITAAMRDAVSLPAEEDGDDDVTWTFIHLVNARYVLGANLVPTTAGMLWRGRLSEISGWSFGTLGSGDEGQALDD